MEVMGTGHRIEGMQIVGQYTGVEQGFTQLCQYPGVVIDPAQDHALVEQGGAGGAQQSQRLAGGLIQFSRMVDVHNHNHLQRQPAQPLQQGVTNPLGNDHRQPGMNTQPADMGNTADCFRPLRQQLIVDGQRIPAAEDDFVDLRALLQGCNHLTPVVRAQTLFPVWKVAAKTVAAVDGALPGDHQQGPAPVFADQTGSLDSPRFLQRVPDKAFDLLAFLKPWQHLQEQRIIGVAGLHAPDERLGDPDRKLPVTFQGPGKPGSGIQVKAFQQGFWCSNGLGQQLLPSRRFLTGNTVFYMGGGSLYHSGLWVFNDIVSGGQFMASYSTSEFRSGLKVLLDGDPCVILENEFVKPGKGQAFNRVKFRNLTTNRVWERTFKSGETLEAADVVDQDMEYLYTDGEFWHFMLTDGSFEQYAADAKAVGDAVKWLKEQDVYTVTLYNGAPLSVTPPNFVELEVVDTDPGIKGDTAQGGSKPATLSTGAVVNVPLFISVGEVVRVDTRTGEYVSRVKSN